MELLLLFVVYAVISIVFSLSFAADIQDKFRIIAEVLEAHSEELKKNQDKP